MNYMKPFHEVVSKIKFTKGENTNDYVVGYFDRIENDILEMPLAAFLDSDIPEHRARCIKKKTKDKAVIVWDRRASS